jgi:hypothetical protein
MPEFGVHVVDKENRALIGRCYQGVIKVGMVFSSAELDGVVEPVSLRIVSIDSYRRSFQEIDVGFVARLIVDGEGLEVLDERSALRAEV